jgi:predicted metal-dependent hydrolase
VIDAKNIAKRLRNAAEILQDIARELDESPELESFAKLLARKQRIWTSMVVPEEKGK